MPKLIGKGSWFIAIMFLYACSKTDNTTTPIPPPPPSPVNIQAPLPFGFYVVGYFPSYRNLSDVPDV